MKSKGKQYFFLILGLLLVAFAFNLFLSPYNFVAGGVSGLAIVVHKVFQINESLFMLVINMFLIGISLKFLGKEKTKNTILGSILFPVFTLLTEKISLLVSLDLDPLLIAILGGAISGFGYGLIFKNNFTTGGTDILNQMAEKYLKIPMSKSILFVDGAIVLLGCITFGIKNMIYSLISLILISELSNKTQLGINNNKVLYIHSKKQEEMIKFLTKNNYDVTLMDSKGGYTKKRNKMIMSSIHEKDYYKIKEGILVIDPEAFIIVTNAYEQKNANVTIRKKEIQE